MWTLVLYRSNYKINFSVNQLRHFLLSVVSKLAKSNNNYKEAPLNPSPGAHYGFCEFCAEIVRHCEMRNERDPQFQDGGVSWPHDATSSFPSSSLTPHKSLAK